MLFIIWLHTICCLVYSNYLYGVFLACTCKPNHIYSVGSTRKSCSPFWIHIHNAGIWCRWCTFISSDKNSSPLCSRHTKHSLLHKWVFLHNHETGTTTIYKERPISSKYFGEPLIRGMFFIWQCNYFLAKTFLCFSYTSENHNQRVMHCLSFFLNNNSNLGVIRNYYLVCTLKCVLCVQIFQSASLCLTTTTPEQLASALWWFMIPLKHIGVPVPEIILTLLLSLRFINLVFDEASIC